MKGKTQNREHILPYTNKMRDFLKFPKAWVPVLGIRDILVRIRIRMHGIQLQIRLLSFSDFKDAKQ
jgi:hypothetical protein